MAEEIVEVNVDEKEVIGSPKTPNKDAITSWDPNWGFFFFEFEQLGLVKLS